MNLPLAALALAGLASAAKVPYTNCGTKTDILSNVAVQATPYPPVPGKAVDISVSGDLSTSVTSGKYTLAVSYDGITIITKTGDICQGMGITCPVTGKLSFSKNEDLPSSVPAGSYDAKISATANGGSALFCADLKLQIGADGETESIVQTGKTAPFKVLHHLIEKAGGAEKAFKAGFEIEVGLEAEAAIAIGGGMGLDAADGDAVQKAGEGSFNGAETLKNLGLMVGGGGDLEVKIAVGAKLKFGIEAGEATWGEEGRGRGKIQG